MKEKIDHYVEERLKMKNIWDHEHNSKFQVVKHLKTHYENFDADKELSSKAGVYVLFSPYYSLLKSEAKAPGKSRIYSIKRQELTTSFQILKQAWMEIENSRFDIEARRLRTRFLMQYGHMGVALFFHHLMLHLIMI